MSIIEASTNGVKDLADGTLRITLEFEPRHARAAFELFGARGTAVAITALKPGIPQAAEVLPKAGRTASQRAWLMCRDASFQRYANWSDGYGESEDGAAKFLKERCGIAESRSEIDSNTVVAAEFDLLCVDFNEWMEARR